MRLADVTEQDSGNEQGYTIISLYEFCMNNFRTTLYFLIIHVVHISRDETKVDKHKCKNCDDVVLKNDAMLAVGSSLVIHHSHGAVGSSHGTAMDSSINEPRNTLIRWNHVVSKSTFDQLTGGIKNILNNTAKTSRLCLYILNCLEC